MEQILNSFELFCIKNSRNVTVNELFTGDGKRELKCTGNENCGHSCDHLSRLNNFNFANNR